MTDRAVIAVVDTERGSASLYSGERGMSFDVMELASYEVERFVEAIKDAVDGGYALDLSAHSRLLREELLPALVGALATPTQFANTSLEWTNRPPL